MNIFETRFYKIAFYPLSLIYQIIVWFRNKCYDNNIFRSFTIEHCYIISVGNISVGGTGKTPVIKFLAVYLRSLGFKLVVLSRGYGRKSKGTVIVSDGEQIRSTLDHSGDEPYLLARQLKNVPIVVEADRYKGARFIREKFQPDIILLDDGFQHRRLKRNMDIVLIDASLGFGAGFLFPAGFLRESISSLRRADMIWFTRVDQSTNLDQLKKQVQNFSSGPILESYHQPISLVQANTGMALEPCYLKKKLVFLFSGIANPGSFEKTITDLGALIVTHLRFPDHYRYQAGDIHKIIQTGEQVRADLIVTTEKDYVRISDLIPTVSNLYFLTVEIVLNNDDLQMLQKKLENLI